MAFSQYDAFLFDLDGTLLHTLPDLVVITNKALEAEHLPLRTEAEVLSYVGNGALVLVRQAVPHGTSEETIQLVYQHFCDLYPEFGIVLTRQFDGIDDTLSKLKTLGKKLGILSNKFERGVKDVEAHYFPGVFDVVHGECDRIPRKPNPAGLLTCAQELGVDPCRCVYVGDSAGDIEAAHNAGMFAVAAAWGYQPLEKLKAAQPDAFAAKPEDILWFV